MNEAREMYIFIYNDRYWNLNHPLRFSSLPRAILLSCLLPRGIPADIENVLHSQGNPLPAHMSRIEPPTLAHKQRKNSVSSTPLRIPKKPLTFTVLQAKGSDLQNTTETPSHAIIPSSQENLSWTYSPISGAVGI
jgi:hypothetical protein